MGKSTHPLQTKAWADFRAEWGNQVLKTKYGYLTIHHIPFTKYKLGMFIKGPSPTPQMVNSLKRIGKENNLIFIKLEPNTKNDEKISSFLKKNGCVQGKTLFTPTTFLIDLSKSEEELMRSFSSKTRYNIRLSQKHGIIIKEDNSQKAFEAYIKLTKQTVQRQGFYAHTKRYHRLMWQHLKSAGIAHLLTATYRKEVITTWILFENDGVLYYPYGASSEKYKNKMANNLMMWEAIRLGKKLGCSSFDLWGREEGKGFTKFKEGYNPEVVEFLGTWDLVIDKSLYKLYKFAEGLRWPILRIRAKLARPNF